MAVRMDPNEIWQRSQGVINQAVGRGAELLADRIEHYSSLATDMSEMLREKGEPQAAEWVDSLAGGVGEAANYLRTHDGTSLWSDAQAFARGRSWLLAGIGLVGGMAAARAVRSANHVHDWEQSDYVESYATQSQPTFGQSSLNGERYDDGL
jgi:hypothetical protein